MHTYCGIIQSQNPETVALCVDVGREIGLTLTVKGDIASLLLELMESDYQVAILDFEEVDASSVVWVKIVRRLRPKLPLIVLCDRMDRDACVEMYEQGIFYLAQRPLNRENWQNILQAAATCKLNDDKAE